MEGAALVMGGLRADSLELCEKGDEAALARTSGWEPNHLGVKHSGKLGCGTS